MDPSGRAKIIEYSNMLPPATCTMCGRGGKTNSELFADPCVFHQWEEVQIYFCIDCVREMGSLFGLADIAELREKLDRKTAEANELSSSVDNLETLLDGFTSERAVRRASTVISNGDLVDFQINRDAINNSQINVGESQPSDDSQSVVEEPVNVEGSDDISEPTGDNTAIDNAALLAKLGI